MLGLKNKRRVKKIVEEGKNINLRFNIINFLMFCKKEKCIIESLTVNGTLYIEELFFFEQFFMYGYVADEKTSILERDEIKMSINLEDCIHKERITTYDNGQKDIVSKMYYKVTKIEIKNKVYDLNKGNQYPLIFLESVN